MKDDSDECVTFAQPPRLKPLVSEPPAKLLVRCNKTFQHSNLSISLCVKLSKNICLFLFMSYNEFRARTKEVSQMFVVAKWGYYNYVTVT